MNRSAHLDGLAAALLPWFYKNKRDLPWRQDRDPYHIWLSEIMLQQTRVEAVKGYYTRFIALLPDVYAVSQAEDDLLNKLWEGLGYYSRVRNLKKAAVMIQEKFEGKFPEKYEQILSLPGIGEYTAGAICSIAFNQKTPAVDGNVLRVFSRITDDSTPIDLPEMKKKAAAALREIYPEEAGDFTQALMELGATVCGPNKKPDCENCPCSDLCLGFRRDTADSLPVKLPKRQRRDENMTVFVLHCDGRYALQKREEDGLLAGLWQFPNVPGHLELNEVIDVLTKEGIQVKDILLQVDKKHIFTHIQWNMRGYYLDVACSGEKFQWFTPLEIRKDAALPTAFRQFWENVENTD